MLRDHFYSGDAATILPGFDADSFDLVMTSPPYANKRKNTYGGISADKYMEWFLPIAAELKRVLKPRGSFILNIKEGCEDGCRQRYVYELVLALCDQGWRWVDDIPWHKTNCFPGWWENRFRDAWEHCYHFTKQKKFCMFQDAVRVPAKESTKLRASRLSEKDMTRQESKVGSGFGRNRSNWVGRDMVYPSNVLYGATECSNQGHSAAFPVWLPEFFVKLFTQRGDVVLDPFMGSGSTALAAWQNGRHYVGIEKLAEYVELARDRLTPEWERDPDDEPDYYAEKLESERLFDLLAE
jgi:site-specific DNA-methyltransferase (adenine-specific)/site-specific DNA-methyltransferase (cytosine-N4-specific)